MISGHTAFHGNTFSKEPTSPQSVPPSPCPPALSSPPTLHRSCQPILTPFHPGSFIFFILFYVFALQKGYVDTINLNIKKSGNDTILRLFNVADIHGALGDNGQSYKTLHYMLADVFPNATMHIAYGCGVGN
jgi:hypothetical protein